VIDAVSQFRSTLPVRPVDQTMAVVSPRRSPPPAAAGSFSNRPIRRGSSRTSASAGGS